MILATTVLLRTRSEIPSITDEPFQRSVQLTNTEIHSTDPSPLLLLALPPTSIRHGYLQAQRLQNLGP